MKKAQDPIRVKKLNCYRNATGLLDEILKLADPKSRPALVLSGGGTLAAAQSILAVYP